MAHELSQDSVLDFLSRSGGKVRNADLLRHFQKFLKGPESQMQYREQFKNIINSLAVVKTEDEVKYIVLRRRFRDLIGENCCQQEHHYLPIPSVALANGHSTAFGTHPPGVVVHDVVAVKGVEANASRFYWDQRNIQEQPSLFVCTATDKRDKVTKNAHTNCHRGVSSNISSELLVTDLMPAFNEFRTSGVDSSFTVVHTLPEAYREKCSQTTPVNGRCFITNTPPVDGVCTASNQPQQVGVHIGTPCSPPRVHCLGYSSMPESTDIIKEYWDNPLQHGRASDRLQVQPYTEAQGLRNSSFPISSNFWDDKQTQNDSYPSLVDVPSFQMSTTSAPTSWRSLDSVLTEELPQYSTPPRSQFVVGSGVRSKGPLTVAHEDSIVWSPSHSQTLRQFNKQKHSSLVPENAHSQRLATYPKDAYRSAGEAGENISQNAHIPSYVRRETPDYSRSSRTEVEAEGTRCDSLSVPTTALVVCDSHRELVVERISPFRDIYSNSSMPSISEKCRWPSSDFQFMVDNSVHNVSAHAKKGQITRSLSSSLPDISRHVAPKLPKSDPPYLSSTHAELSKAHLSRKVGSSQKLESVPLDQKEHNWIVSLATGSLNQAYGLLLEDPTLATKKDFISGYTALHWIAKHGDMNSLYVFFNGATKAGITLNVNVKTGCGYTPLHIAAIHGHHKVIKLLVRKFSASVSIRDSSGRKPWQYLNREAPSESWQLLGAPKSHTTVFGEGSPDRSALHSTTTVSKHISRKASLAALLKHQHLRWKTSKSHLAAIRDTEDDSD